MFRFLPAPSEPRRALLDDLDDAEERSWVSHGVAALAISVLGLAVAGSVTLTSSAQNSSSTLTTTVSRSQINQTQLDRVQVSQAVGPNVSRPSAFDRRGGSLSRGSGREPVATQAQDDQTDDQLLQRSESLRERSGQVSKAAESAALHNRQRELAAAASKARQKARQLTHQAEERQRQAKRQRQRAVAKGANAATAAAAATSRGSALPVSTYRISGRFGQVGVWARYHTGLDFAAPVGTPIHAPAAGVVTHTGFGGTAGGWAGDYITIRHSGGMSTLYAHTSGATVSTGQSVRAGQLIGHVGMTGRAFGAHLHFEVYPAGATPGDVYSAIDPAGWLAARGQHP